MKLGARDLGLERPVRRGTGQISLTSVREAVATGYKVTVFNRGKSSMAEVPADVTSIVGDIDYREPTLSWVGPHST